MCKNGEREEKDFQDHHMEAKKGIGQRSLRPHAKDNLDYIFAWIFFELLEKLFEEFAKALDCSKKIAQHCQTRR
jgi:hypothetical protein